MLHEHPSMAFDVLGAVTPRWRTIFRLRKYLSPCPSSAVKVSVNVVDVHKHPVNDPRNRRPLPCLLAALLVLLGALIRGCRRSEHHNAVTGVQFGVTYRSVRRCDPVSFHEAERSRKPIDGRRRIGVRDHRHNTLEPFHWYPQGAARRMCHACCPFTSLPRTRKCRYVRADPVVCASFWRGVLCCDHERGSADMRASATKEERRRTGRTLDVVRQAFPVRSHRARRAPFLPQGRLLTGDTVPFAVPRP